ncbi:MAG: integral membrane protein-like protein [uncultured bacterium]|nr:MAG: integral membrane protein-like protein [uncultured bacterium]
MIFIKKHFLFLLFLLGLIFRLSIIFYDYSWDVNNHMVWAKDFIVRGPQNFYETQSSNVFANLTPNYPPLAIFIFVLMKLLNPLIHNAYWWLNLHISIIPSNLIFFLEKTVFLAALMKLPAILADLGIALLVYVFAKKIVPRNIKTQIICVSLILFNPAFIYNSALWGQIDSIPIFFVMLSVYYLLYTKQNIISSILFTLALLIKPTVLIFLPVYIFLFIQKFGIKKSILNLFVVNIIFYLFFLPFTLSPYKTYLDKILGAQSLPYVTNGAFNFWVLITSMKGIKDVASFLFEIPYKYFGYLIVGSINIFVILQLIKSKKITEDFFMALFLTAFGAFLFLTKMHERYSLLPLVFLLIYSFKKNKFISWFIFLSIISFINHYHNWAVPRIEFIMKIIDNMPFIYIISSLNVLVFIYLSGSFFLSILSRRRALTIK